MLVSASPQSLEAQLTFPPETLGELGASLCVKNFCTTNPAALISSTEYYTEPNSQRVSLSATRSRRHRRPFLPQTTSPSTNTHREDRSTIQSRLGEGPLRESWRLCHNIACLLYDTRQLLADCHEVYEPRGIENFQSKTACLRT